MAGPPVPAVPQIPKLTVRGQQYLTMLGVILALVTVAFISGRCSGERAVQTKVDTAAEKALKQQLDVLTKKAAALEKVAATVQKQAAATVTPHVRAKARSDTAATTETVARAALEHVLADTAATLQVVRGAADSLIRSDSAAMVRFRAERDAADARIVAQTKLITADSAVIVSQAAVIQQSQQDRSAQVKIIADLKGQQHGLVHRIIDGVLVVVATGGCAAAGSLLSPAGAIAAGGVCLVAVSSWAP